MSAVQTKTQQGKAYNANRPVHNYFVKRDHSLFAT